MRILTIDIETTPHITYTWGLFNQNIGLNQIVEPTRVLCFAAKWLDEKEVLFYRSDGSAEEQRAMAQAAYDLLTEADAVVGWNSDGFDIPHLNREFYEQGWAEPEPYASIDLIKTARKRFRFASNKLDWVSKVSKVGAKLAHHGMPVWVGCMHGDEAMWKIMTRYNKQDVRITERDYLKFLPWIQNHPSVPLHDGYGDIQACPNCGSHKATRQGSRSTSVSTFPRFRCANPKCGHWYQGTKSIARSGYR